MCDDLVVDALYHLHLLHPSRFRNDCITEFKSIAHHTPDIKTNDGFAIVRFHKKTHQVEALTWDTSGNVKLSPVDHCIIANQKWKIQSHGRIIPGKNISETGEELYLSMFKPNEELRLDWKMSTKIILGLSALALEENIFVTKILQDWKIVDNGIVPAAVGYLNLWKDWGFEEEEEKVVF